jgi:hypothetical protein
MQHRVRQISLAVLVLVLLGLIPSSAQAAVCADFPSQAAAHAVRAHARAIKDALALWHADYDYYNFLETRADAQAVLPHDVFRRLREIKAIYDPDEAILSAHPVRPARH